MGSKREIVSYKRERDDEMRRKKGGVGRGRCWTSFVLSGLGRGVYLALWDARVRRLHVSPQSGLPRIRT